jgi:hypothetical protein
MKNLLNAIDDLLWPLGTALLVILASVHFVPMFIGLLIF